MYTFALECWQKMKKNVFVHSLFCKRLSFVVWTAKEKNGSDQNVCAKTDICIPAVDHYELSESILARRLRTNDVSIQDQSWEGNL